ncbi:MAG: hypothetical protein DDT31_01015 [Syntrophomonadaceae bacterium]|nr:hypothetical protein [Bacillota bacterium]
MTIAQFEEAYGTDLTKINPLEKNLFLRTHLQEFYEEKAKTWGNELLDVEVNSINTYKFPNRDVVRFTCEVKVEFGKFEKNIEGDTICINSFVAQFDTNGNKIDFSWDDTHVYTRSKENAPVTA